GGFQQALGDALAQPRHGYTFFHPITFGSHWHWRRRALFGRRRFGVRATQMVDHIFLGNAAILASAFYIRRFEIVFIGHFARGGAQNFLIGASVCSVFSFLFGIIAAVISLAAFAVLL